MHSAQLLASNNGPTTSSSRQGPKSLGDEHAQPEHSTHVPEVRVGALSAGAPGATASNSYPTMEAKQCGRAFDNVSRI